MKKKKNISPKLIVKREPSYMNWVGIGLIILVAAIALAPIVFEGKVFYASDSLQWVGAAKSMADYRTKTGQEALWATNLFGGMPGFMIDIVNRVWALDTIMLRTLGQILDWRFLYMILMGLGVYFLLRKLKASVTASSVGAVIFQLSTYFLILLKTGHNTKFKAIAFIPWVFLAVYYLLIEKSWWGILGFSITTSLQLRASHPQVSYYTFLAVGIFWVVWFFDTIRERNYQTAWKQSVFLLIGFLISLLLVLQPYWSNYEYSKYSTRGTTYLGAGEGGGLTKEYALAWSFDWLESFTFIAPDVLGGASPYYWGQMPFTEGPAYLGAVGVILAFFAFMYRRDRITITFGIISLIVWLVSMGSNFSLLSNFLLDHFPFYDKFRAPSTILIILSFTTAVLAGLGLDGVQEKLPMLIQDPEQRKKFYYAILAILGLAVLMFLISSGWNYLRPGEGGQYDARTLASLKVERQNLTQDSIIRYLLYAIVLCGMIFAYAYQKISKSILGILLILLAAFELYSYDQKYLTNLVAKEEVEKTFTKTGVDNFLLEDQSIYRILPLGNLFTQTRFSYYHQSLAGYHAAKLGLFQDLVDHVLYQGPDPNFPVNWNLLKLFNVKYLIAQGQINQSVGLMDPVFHDGPSNLTLFEFKEPAPRVFFVPKIIVEPDPKVLIRRLNEPGFDPQSVAYLDRECNTQIEPDPDAKAQITEFNPNLLRVQFSTSKPQFLFISEMYYPAGWKAFIDGTVTRIYRTNYAFRGVVVPPGEHTLKLSFEPVSYYLGIKITWAVTILVYSLGVFYLIRKKISRFHPEPEVKSS